jgi:glycine/sarcosine N-methyltransferase
MTYPFYTSIAPYYQHIVSQDIKELPLIDNEQVCFVRRYEFGEPGSITFHTQLTVKSTGAKINNSIPLHAIEKDQLHVFLEKAGFTSIEFFGGFNLGPFSENSFSLVVSCQKK